MEERSLNKSSRNEIQEEVLDIDSGSSGIGIK